jgi:signal peptidase I
MKTLPDTLNSIAPPLKGGGLRENFEILVVALVVAMGLRAYFLQPFKIPTGSMQPTLYGITSKQKDSPDLTDRFPINFLKFAVTGQNYSEHYAKSSGTLRLSKTKSKDPSVLLFDINGKLHKIPRDAVIYFARDQCEIINKPGTCDFLKTGDLVKKGDLLWSGIVTRGDHIFVNKIIWNLRKPKRGEIMVFKTSGIATLQQGTHYIKRMCGLPTDQVSIQPPNLVINGEIITGIKTIDRVASDPNYDGYQLAGKLNSSDLEWPLTDTQYFAMGDNTGNSKDSRYWGPVPEKNLVGPAVIIYWPFSKRWGLAK